MICEPLAGGTVGFTTLARNFSDILAKIVCAIFRPKFGESGQTAE